MNMLNQKQKIVAIIGGIVIVGIFVFYYINSTKDLYGYDEIQNAEAEEEPEEEKKQEIKNKIIIHITGAVTNEGIVSVDEDARINDVIEAAGGLTEDAELINVNLAYLVEDGQKIYIPSKKDNTEDGDDGEIVFQDAGKSVLKEEEEKQNEKIVNINTATEAELTSIPGVGSSTAEKIITYRKENGKFKQVEDIKNVSGIGEKKFEAIKVYIKT